MSSSSSSFTLPYYYKQQGEEEADRARNIRGIIFVYAIAGLLWFVYNVTLRRMYGDIISDKLPVIKLGTNFKCIIKHGKCEAGDIDGWSFMHAIINSICGYYYPNEYGFMLALAIGTEVFEAKLGYRPRYILDPVTNMLAYAGGAYYAKSLQKQ